MVCRCTCQEMQRDSHKLLPSDPKAGDTSEFIRDMCAPSYPLTGNARTDIGVSCRKWRGSCCRRSAHLEHGLLLFISGKHEDAWQELSLYEQSSRSLHSCEAGGERNGGRDDLHILIEKARLMSVAVHW